MQQMTTNIPTMNSDTLYQHRVRPEWGLAVLAWDRDGRRGYQFEDGALRVFKRGYYQFLEPVDRPLDETQQVFDELSRKIGRRRAARRLDHAPIPVAGQIDFFTAAYPKGFRGVKWARERRGIDAKKVLKRHRNPVLARARQLFSAERLSAELDAGRASQLVTELRELLSETSLVTQRQMRGLEQVSDSQAERLFAALRDLMTGSDDPSTGFDRWLGALRAATGNKPSWSMATVVPALLEPNSHICVKRTTFERQAAWMAPSLVIGKEPSGAIYGRIVDMSRTLAAKLKESGLEPRDNLDIRDFIDMTLRPAAIEQIAAAQTGSSNQDSDHDEATG